jgi:hypothetical protein
VDARGFAKTVTLRKPLIAHFEQSGLTDWEQIAVYEKFTFSGLAEGVNPLTTVSVFDTETFCQRFGKDSRDEINVQMDKRLREQQLDNPSQFIIVDPPEAPRPWPSYDEMHTEEILSFQEILKVSPDQIRLYELENKNRDEIVLAMLRLSDPKAATRYEAKLRGEDFETEEEKAASSFGDTSKLEALLEGEQAPTERVIVDA